MRAIVEDYRLMIFCQIWHSMLFVQKAAPMAQSYLEGAVKFCQELVDEVVPDAGILFDPETIGRTMVGPPPGWNGNEHDAVDAMWWKDYLDQVLKAVPLQGPDAMPYFEPLQKLDPSISVDPEFLMEEEDFGTDYSALLEVSPSRDQSAIPGDGSGPSNVFPDDPPSNPPVN